MADEHAIAGGGVNLSPDDCQHYSDALADVLCWFRGFRAARPEAELPPGLDVLRSMNITLKRGWGDE